MADIITNGRKKNCGACGASESNELMQFIGIEPIDSGILMFPSEMYGKGNDLPILLQLDNVLAEL